MKNIIEKINDLKAIANNTINKKKIDNSKGFSKEDFFRRDFYYPLIEQVKSTLSKLTPTNELTELLDDWIIEISLKTDSNTIINEFWADFKSDITNIKNKIEESIFPVPENKQPEKATIETLTIPKTEVFDKEEYRNLIKDVMKEELKQNKADVFKSEIKQQDKLITEPQTIPKSEMANITREEFKSIVKDVMKEIIKDNNGDASIKTEDDDLIKIEEVAKIFKVSLVTIHKWKKEGLIPFLKLKRRLYFKKSDVLNSMRKIGKKSSGSF